MSFRRQKDGARRSTEWSRFRQQSSQLFDRVGLPAHIYESEGHFQDFLMHGYLDHHERPYRFSVRNLDESQRQALRELVVSYLAEGFRDPGLGLFGSAEHDAMRAAAQSRK